MREYSYRSHDFSLLTPRFKKWIVAPLLNFVPWALPANIITLISNLFVYLGFFIALYFDGPVFRLMIAACLLIYLVGDHLDGMQAKKTGTGSALGEFIDHYLDAFNNGIILFTAFLVFNISDPVLVVLTLSASYLAHTSVFYEQFKTGWLTFEKLGSLEAVLLTSLLIGISCVNPLYSFLSLKALFSLRIIELVFALSAMGAFFTFIATTLRTPKKGKQLWLFVLSLIVLAFSTITCASPLQSFVLISLFASFYVGLVMKGHLVDGIEYMPDLVIPLILILLQFFQSPIFHFAFIILTIYLSLRIIIFFIQTFWALKTFWVWSNQPSSTK